MGRLRLMADYALVTSTRIARSNTASHEARRFLADHERDWLTREVLSDALLLVSETVTNAIRHGEAEEMELVVRLSDEVLWVGVSQPSTYSPDGEPKGIGTMIIDSLASRWGDISWGQDTMVWFEIDRERHVD